MFGSEFKIGDYRSKRKRRHAPAILVIALIVAHLLTCSPSRADQIVQFALSDIVFWDATYATGSFTLDETTGSITDFNVTYFGGGLSGVPSATFAPASDGSSASYSSSVPAVGFITTNGELLSLVLAAPLGTGIDQVKPLVNVIGGSAVTAVCTYYCSEDEVGLSPSATNAALDPIPEPPALPILVAATGLLVVAQRALRRPTTDLQLGG